MNNHCCYCNTRCPAPSERYPHGTKIMALRFWEKRGWVVPLTFRRGWWGTEPGWGWFEFCEPCGDEVTLTNHNTGEIKTLSEIVTELTA